MASWVADNPPVPRPRLQPVDHLDVQGEPPSSAARAAAARTSASTCGKIDQNMLVVTAGADHIAPRPGTLPLLDLVASEDVTHLDRPGGHIGLMAGSKARKEIWPDIAEWLEERSDSLEEETTNERNRDTGTPRGRHRPAQARGPRGAGHRRHARHRRRHLPQPRRPGRDRRRRLLLRTRRRPRVISRRSRSRARPAASTRATSASTRTASASSRRSSSSTAGSTSSSTTPASRTTCRC